MSESGFEAFIGKATPAVGADDLRRVWSFLNSKPARHASKGEPQFVSSFWRTYVLQTRMCSRCFFRATLSRQGRPSFPVPLKTYDESIAVLRSGLDRAKLGDSDKMDGFKRLDQFVRAIENRCEPRANFRAALAHEKSISLELGGRTVFDRKES